MAKATQEFYFDGKEYAVGDDVPDEVAGKVSANVVDDRPEVDTSAFDGDEAFEAAVEARVQAALEGAGSEAVDAAVAAVRDAEKAAFEALVTQDEFDPSEGDAPGVKAYLEGLDRDTAAGAYEYDRVVQAEKDGKDRSTAIPADPEDESSSDD